MKIKQYQIAVIAITLGLAAIFGVTAETAHSGLANGPINPTCISSAPCIEYDNNGSGLAIRGVGLTGNGIGGVTKQNSTSASNARAGLVGFDVSTSGTFNSGVKGISIHGTGLTGVTTSGTGVTGTSTSGTGMFGSGIIGLEGENTSNASSDAVVAKGFGGRLFRANNSQSVDVFTIDDSGNSTQSGSATLNGYMLSNGTVFAGYDINNLPNYGVLAQSVGIALFLQDFSFNDGGALIEGFDSSDNLRFWVDDFGDVYAHTFNATLLTTRQATSAGPEITTYANQTSTPTVEDFGEGQLVGGRASVALERTFATTINRTAGYMVFITPEGDTHGLYVTQKSAGGFVVRENQGGRSTVAFSYRIVARPFGSTATRLPAAKPMRGVAPLLTHPAKRPSSHPDLVRSFHTAAQR